MTPSPIKLQSVLKLLGSSVIRIVGRTDREIRFPIPLSRTTDSHETFSFCEKEGEAAVRLLSTTRAEVVFCLEAAEVEKLAASNRTFLCCAYPRLCFMRVLREFFTPTRKTGIHPSAVIHPDASIHPTATIGPHTIVDRCQIGEGVTIYGNTHLYDGCSIGKFSIIHAGSSLGADGFHFHPNEKGDLEKFPSLAGVTIGEEVEIGPLCSIARGTLTDTRIGACSKLDSLVHVGHSAVIGNRCRIVAGVIIAGNVEIHDDVWIGPNAVLSNNITVAGRAFISLGSVVVGNLNEAQRVSGNFAIDHSAFLACYARSLKSTF